jgi:hypothetical protein
MAVNKQYQLQLPELPQIPNEFVCFHRHIYKRGCICQKIFRPLNPAGIWCFRCKMCIRVKKAPPVDIIYFGIKFKRYWMNIK